MSKVLVCGSIAYDHIMEFPGFFKEQILPDRIDSLNVSFLVNSLKKMRGGTAPNIAYNLALLGLEPFVLGTVGQDFNEYREWLNKNGVDTRYVRVLDDDYTASCFITTDMNNNQITGFYPGAMKRDVDITLKGVDLNGISLVIIAPTEPEAMIKWAVECQELGVDYLFDAGMQIPRLSGHDLSKGIMGAKIAVFNEYEADLMQKKTGLLKNEILNSVEILVETLGEKGSILRTWDEKVFVPAAKPVKVEDPTGAGDAYRAGLLKGYFEGASLEEMGRLANISAVYAVEHKGGQEHRYGIDDFYTRYNQNYGVEKVFMK
ncbi:MAG: carbohydrate kinase family protein [Clostridiaceae bacterium]|nr:carbohydrate kinase family protein [Clostridiaceae bacterium]